MKNERLTWIDGLRGLACILIFTHHFLVSFFPSSYNGDPNTSRMIYGLDVKWANSPLSFIICGNFWVSVFCLVSGLVLGYQVYRAKTTNEVSSMVLKRYPRLCFPLAVVSFAAWIMMQFSLFPTAEVQKLSTSSWIVSAYGDKPSFLQFLNTTFVATWLNGDHTYSPAFWLMNIFLSGSFLAYLLSLMTKNRKLPSILVFICFTAFFLYTDALFNLAFTLGVALAYRIFYFDSAKIYKIFWCTVCSSRAVSGRLSVRGLSTGLLPVARCQCQSALRTSLSVFSHCGRTVSRMGNLLSETTLHSF